MSRDPSPMHPCPPRARARAQLAAAGRVGECVGAALAVGGAHSGCSRALVVGQPKASKGSDEPRPKSHASATPLSACAQLAAAGRVGECVGAALAVVGELSKCSRALVLTQPKVSKGTHEARPKSHASVTPDCE